MSARRLAVPAFFAALVGAAGQVRVPIPGSHVPLTLQVVAVLLAGACQRPAAAAGSMVLFVAAGMAGAPVFSGGGAGAAYLLGPTGGYLIGFVAGAAACSAILAGRRSSVAWTLLAMTACVAIVHLLGALHLGLYLGGDFRAATESGVLPFLPGDLLKIAAAASISAGAAAIAPRAE